MFKKDNIPEGGGVYIYLCKITYLKYVGKCTCFRERVWHEILSMRGFVNDGKHRSVITIDLQEDFKKYGEESFELSYYTVADEEVADVLEYYFIKKYNCVYDGYNGNYRDIKNIFEKHASRIYPRRETNILNEEETMLAHELQKIFNYKEYFTHEYVSYYQFLNELRAIYNKELEEIELLKIIKSLKLYVYIKSGINDFYYDITINELEGLILRNNRRLNDVIRDEFLEFDNILENIVIQCFKFDDKKDYIEKVNKYNINYLEYIDRLEEDIYFLKKKHLNNIKSYNDINYFESIKIIEKAKNIKKYIENDIKCLEKSKKRLIDTPRYIKTEEDKIINNPKMIKKIEIVRIKD